MEEVVRVVYQLGGIKEAQAGAEGLAGALDKSEGAAHRSSGAFSQLTQGLTGYMGFRALTSDARQAAGALINLSSEAEDTRIAIAGMLQAGGAGGLQAGAEGFTQAMGMSADIMGKIRKDARDLPGEVGDLLNIFRGSLQGGLEAGKSTLDVESLSARMMAVSKVLQIPSEVAGREMSQLMEGRAGAHNVLWQRLKGNIGVTAQEFNAFSSAEKWDRIDKAIHGYDGAVKEFGNTWSAVESTAEDYVKQVARIGGEPIFNTAKVLLKEISEYYEQHQQQIDAIAKAWGQDVADGIRKGFGEAKEVLGWIVDHKDALIAVAEAYAVYKVSSVAGGAFGGAGKGGVGGNAAQFGNMAASAAVSVAAARLANDMSGMGDGVNIARDATMALSGALALTGPLGVAVAALAQAANLAAGMLDKIGHRNVEAEALGSSVSSLMRREMDPQRAGEYSGSLAELNRLQDGGGPLTKEESERQSWNAQRIVEHTAALANYAQELHAVVNGKVDRGILAATPGMNEQMVGWVANAYEQFTRAKALLPAAVDPNAKNATNKKTDINVTNYNRFETEINQADNPDRAYAMFSGVVRDALLFPKESAVSQSGVLR